MKRAATKHARERWAERFADRDMDAELEAAKAPTKGRLNKLLIHIPTRYRTHVAGGGSFLISSVASPPAVFVLAPGGLTLTVYPLEKTAHKSY